MVESEAKACDAALAEGLSQLFGRVTENEANCVAGAVLMMEYLEQFRAENQRYHDGLMQYFGSMQGNLNHLSLYFLCILVDYKFNALWATLC